MYACWAKPNKLNPLNMWHIDGKKTHTRTHSNTHADISLICSITLKKFRKYVCQLCNFRSFDNVRILRSIWLRIITFDYFAVLLCETSHSLWRLPLNFCHAAERERCEKREEWNVYEIDAEECALSSLKIISYWTDESANTHKHFQTHNAAHSNSTFISHAMRVNCEWNEANDA